jgi:signal transduction histidine kinase
MGIKSWIKDSGSRALIYALLIVFNVSLWTMLVVFRWEVSLRTREVEYFDRQLFPIGFHIVPFAVVFIVCIVLSVVSIGVIVRDRINLAERKKLQTLLEQILESLEIGVIVLDRKGLVILANQSARKILPLQAKHPSDLKFLDVIRGYPQVEGLVKSALQEGNYTKEKEQNIGSAEDALTVRITTLPFRNRQGRIDGTLVLIDNVSDEVALQRQMRDAEKLSTMGTLAAALAHEIRNPLEALNLNLELLQRIQSHIRVRSPEGEKIGKYMRILDSEVSRLAGVVENFLSFARPGNSAMNHIRLDALLHQVIELIENQAQSRSISIGLKTGDAPIVIRGFEDRLKQLFLNLIINGMDAMPGGGALFIQAGVARTAEKDGNSSLAVVYVQDTGEGIPPEKLHRLFEPFFSTRTQGTGLGLTIAERIAREHGGIIRVESVQGKGSKFTVELPVSV